jgi:hypothetical protein
MWVLNERTLCLLFNYLSNTMTSRKGLLFVKGCVSFFSITFSRNIFSSKNILRATLVRSAETHVSVQAEYDVNEN